MLLIHTALIKLVVHNVTVVSTARKELSFAKIQIQIQMFLFYKHNLAYRQSVILLPKDFFSNCLFSFQESLMRGEKETGSAEKETGSAEKKIALLKTRELILKFLICSEEE